MKFLVLISIVLVIHQGYAQILYVEDGGSDTCFHYSFEDEIFKQYTSESGEVLKLNKKNTFTLRSKEQKILQEGIYTTSDDTIVLNLSKRRYDELCVNYVRTNKDAELTCVSSYSDNHGSIFVYPNDSLLFIINGNEIKCSFDSYSVHWIGPIYSIDIPYYNIHYTCEKGISEFDISFIRQVNILEKSDFKEVKFIVVDNELQNVADDCTDFPQKFTTQNFK